MTVIATGTAGDAEMAARIAMHRARRPPRWTVIEEPLQLAAALAGAAHAEGVTLVDCLTLWLSNLMGDPDPERIVQEVERLIAILPDLPGDHILVGNEVGFGIVPVNALARRFADEAGVLHQRLAGICDRVILMVAGLPLAVKVRDAGLLDAGLSGERP